MSWQWGLETIQKNVGQKLIPLPCVFQLQEVGIPLSGNTVLNVGFGFGLNTEAMSSMGAKVFGVEPDTGPTTRPYERKSMRQTGKVSFHN